MTPQEFGELIRVRREAKGLSVEEVAARIKLSARTLRSIEDGVMDGLPHAVYARGFLRSYGQCVGMSQQEIDEGLNTVFPTSLFEDSSPLPGPIDRQRNNGGKRGGDRAIAFTIFVLLVILPLTAGWFIVDRFGSDIFDFVKRPFTATFTSAHTETSAPATIGNSTSTVEPAAGADARLSGNSTALRPANATGQPPSATAGAAMADAAPAAASTQASVADTTTPPVAAAQQGNAESPAGHSVTVDASAECWVQATADGAEPWRVTLNRGDKSVFPFKKNLTLMLGNAGGVKLRYNGAPYAFSGRSGEVKTLKFPPAR